MTTRRTLAISLAAAALLGAIQAPSAAGSAAADDPLTRPIAPEAAARWLTPQEPARIYGNSYLVGFGALNVALIRTEGGLILIDGAVPQAVSSVEANIRKLGFRVQDIRLILSTEPHFDHAGGLAALARDSGATVVASGPGAHVLHQGYSDADDPQTGLVKSFPPVAKIRVVADGEMILLGKTAITARATPGHTAGSMSWTWRSCEKTRCLNIVFASSLNPISADGYRFSDPAHAATRAAFTRSFAVVRHLPCDILLTAHPDQSGGDVKFRRLQRRPVPNPFVEPGACRAYADKFAGLFNARIAQEGGKKN
jgi:metallo-beta-lactamase class B